MDFQEMIKIATSKLNHRRLSKDCEVSSVVCVILTENGNIYSGVSIDAACGIGFCAEHSAIAQMVANNESKIKRLVAIGKNRKIYPPCGRCRELIFQINNENLSTEIMVSENKIITLNELLPFRWNSH